MNRLSVFRDRSYLTGFVLQGRSFIFSTAEGFIEDFFITLDRTGWVRTGGNELFWQGERTPPLPLVKHFPPGMIDLPRVIPWVSVACLCFPFAAVESFVCSYRSANRPVQCKPLGCQLECSNECVFHHKRWSRLDIPRSSRFLRNSSICSAMESLYWYWSLARAPDGMMENWFSPREWLGYTEQEWKETTSVSSTQLMLRQPLSVQVA